MNVGEWAAVGVVVWLLLLLAFFGSRARRERGRQRSRSGFGSIGGFPSSFSHAQEQGSGYQDFDTGRRDGDAGFNDSGCSDSGGGGYSGGYTDSGGGGYGGS